MCEMIEQAPGQNEPIRFDRAELDQSIVARFTRVAAASAGRTAVFGPGGQLTYRALDARTNQVANAILDRTRPGMGCVAFLVDHSPDMVVCALAILKAAKAYLCIHPAMPLSVQGNIIGDAAPDLLITNARYLGSLREFAVAEGLPILCLEDIDARYSEAAPAVSILPHDPAAIFYTSGSTGRPKGVLISHRTVLHRAWLCTQYERSGVADHMSLLTSCSFASSQSDLFGALLNGATLELYDIASQGLVRFGAWIDQRGITILHPPVVLFRRYLATLKGSDLHGSVRLVALAGEAVTLADIQLWRARFALSCGLNHRFSSSEAGHIAVACIAPHETRAAALARKPSAVADKHLSIELDGQVAPAGVAGELVVRSAFLADGYWRRAQSVDDPFQPAAEGSEERSVRTGDIGRLLADGSFEFLGRQDNQVKIRGYRVELYEIEQALHTFPAIREAAVIADTLDDKSILTAFVVPVPGTVVEVGALRSHLWSLLSPWKRPSRIHVIEALPLTATGKIDKPHLKQRAQAKAGADPSRKVAKSDYAASFGAAGDAERDS
jgi:amino acid adenylation domain-containing protein